MKRILTGITALGMLATVANATTIVNDTFDQGALDEKVWNDGSGFRFHAETQNVTLTTFDRIWGAKGDNTGAAGLNSKVGSASFTVAQDGTNPFGGNFMIGSTECCDTASALVRIDLSVKGAGSYEIVWNNSGAKVEFHMASGWTGTIEGNSYVWIVDGNTSEPHWGVTDAEANVSVGDAAGRFGFWSLDPDQFAVIDDVVVADTTVMSAPSKEEAQAAPKNP